MPSRTDRRALCAGSGHRAPAGERRRGPRGRRPHRNGVRPRTGGRARGRVGADRAPHQPDPARRGARPRQRHPRRARTGRRPRALPRRRRAAALHPAVAADPQSRRVADQDRRPDGHRRSPPAPGRAGPDPRRRPIDRPAAVDRADSRVGEGRDPAARSAQRPASRGPVAQHLRGGAPAPPARPSRRHRAGDRPDRLGQDDAARRGVARDAGRRADRCTKPTTPRAVGAWPTSASSAADCQQLRGATSQRWCATSAALRPSGLPVR